MRRIASMLLVLSFLPAGAASAASQEEIALASSDRAPRFLLASESSSSKAERVIEPGAVVSLRRRISLDLDGVTLEEALTTIASKANFRLAYSKGIIPLDSRVQLQARNITAAGALVEVLMDTGVDVLVTATGQVVLVKRQAQQEGSITGRVTDARTHDPIQGVSVRVLGTPFGATSAEDGSYDISGIPAGDYSVVARRLGYMPHTVRSVAVKAQESTTVDFALDPAPRTLEQVVVTGTVVPTERKAIPTPITVVTSDQIAQQNLQSIDQVFRYMIPGGVQSEETPGLGGYTSYSVRGTSALGAASTLKVLVDGIEVQDPAYVNNIDPSIVDHIEIISGPQASTIYGSGAISGVMQIFTKRGREGQTKPVLSGKAAVGMVDDKWNSDPRLGSSPLRQDYSFNVNGGQTGFGYNVGASWQKLGAWSPWRKQTAGSLFGGAHIDQGRFSADLTARYRDEYDYSGINPLRSITSTDTTTAQPVGRADTRWATFGMTAGYKVTPHWQHNLTVGYDGHTGANYAAHPQYRTPADSLVSVSTSDWHATSVKYNTSYDAALSPAAKLVTTIGADYTSYSQVGYSASRQPGTTGSFSGTSAYRTASRISGYFGQAQLGLNDELFFTVGVHADNSPGETSTAWSPRAGVSWVRDFERVTLKARFAYGDALVAPDPDQSVFKDYGEGGVQLANPNLQPNRQRGFDTGVELYFGSRGSVGLTYFDQKAINLIDLVFLPDTTSDGRSQSQYQNIGTIHNRGWEITATYTPSSVLALSANFGSARSTLQSISSLYTGDFREGDNLTEVPKWTAGATAAWTPLRNGPTITGSLIHRATWTDVDFVAFFDALLRTHTYTGSRRDYWIDYPAYTKFNLGLSQTITPQLTGFLQVDNVANSYKYERINLIAPMGRVTTIGLKWQVQ